MSDTAIAAEPPGLTRKGRATRARIVEAAARLMFENGVTRTSIDDVRQAAGVSSSQLYHYFADKQELVRAVVRHQADEVLAAQQPLLSNLDSFESLRIWRDAIVDLQRNRNCAGGCPIGSLLPEVAEVDAVARDGLADGFSRWEHAISRGIAAMRDRGELRADADPERLGLGVLAALQGGLLLTQARRDTEALSAALDLALDHLRTYATDGVAGA
ncbi:TetR/AcrR family transcriptional regulator [Pseudonocardia spinosispora]|uniref:TetR/AcrR family transcriptional regulator n=1 Tax=Pseudonocardia spinosispora TaxID=103441 RepID=UPI0004096FB0|nr:TetR/AcrR family transcriptional regulator [Pseudonocardia spinosispora]